MIRWRKLSAFVELASATDTGTKPGDELSRGTWYTVDAPWNDVRGNCQIVCFVYRPIAADSDDSRMVGKEKENTEILDLIFNWP